MMTNGQLVDGLKAIGVSINPAALSYYLKLGIISPAEDTKGRGRVKRFSAANLTEVIIAKTLEDRGLRLSAIKKVMDSIRRAK